MIIEWENIYTGSEKSKKFEPLPKLIPWLITMEENVHLTAEWLFRDARALEVRFHEEPILNPVKDGWYNCEFEDGRFLHACYPQDLLKFRAQYEGLFQQIPDLNKEGITQAIDTIKLARRALWSAWNCIGGDGMRKEPKQPKEDLFYLTIHSGIQPWVYWPRHWTNQCSRCCAPLPKSLQVWVKLQHSKLKNAQ
jgi:hypothetical protein